MLEKPLSREILTSTEMSFGRKSLKMIIYAIFINPHKLLNFEVDPRKNARKMS